MLPASAGMILRPPAADLHHHGAPRIRGDDPQQREAGFWQPWAPRIRGDDPGQQRTQLQINSAPRIRGDDPALANTMPEQTMCSPHPRG